MDQMTVPPPWIKAQAAQLHQRRGHAWLLRGPSGLGQYELALELARGWLCDQPGADGACGRCPSCHAIEVRGHTDLAVLMPETFMLELQWPLGQKAQDEIDDKKRKPSREIRIDAMRDVVEFAQRTSGRGRGKVVLIYPAERMNAVTANALLKTLEEPPGDVRFVLAAEAAHLLLPTIRSRCQGHAMAWPQERQALEWLHEQGLKPGDAQAMLRATGGRPHDALKWAQAGREAAAWHRLPRAMAAGDAGALDGWSPAEAVDALQRLCHDLQSLGAGGPPRFYEPSDLPPAPSGQALGEWWRELLRAAPTVEHPFNAVLMVEALVSQARSALNSGR